MQAAGAEQEQVLEPGSRHEGMLGQDMPLVASLGMLGQTLGMLGQASCWIDARIRSVTKACIPSTVNMNNTSRAEHPHNFTELPGLSIRDAFLAGEREGAAASAG